MSAAVPAPEISVLVATRDRAPSLERLLRSLDALDARGVTHEVLVADNGSLDDTPRLLADWCGGGPGRASLRVAEPGKSRALNLAAEVARGAILAFLDDDVVVERGWLVAIRDYFARRDFAAAQGAVVWSEVASADPELRALLERYKTVVHIDFAPDDGRQRLTGANMTVRRAVFLRLRGFDERLGPGAAGASEDTELADRIRAGGGAIGYIAGARVVHEVDRSRLTEAYFREHHRRIGRSRAIYKRSGLLSSTLPNLVKASLDYALFAALGNEPRKYRAKGRYHHYRAMLEARRPRKRGASR